MGIELNRSKTFFGQEKAIMMCLYLLTTLAIKSHPWALMMLETALGIASSFFGLSRVDKLSQLQTSGILFKEPVLNSLEIVSLNVRTQQDALRHILNLCSDEMMKM